MTPTPDYIDAEIAACNREIVRAQQRIQRLRDKINFWNLIRDIRRKPEAAAGTINYTVRPRTA